MEVGVDNASHGSSALPVASKLCRSRFLGFVVVRLCIVNVSRHRTQLHLAMHDRSTMELSEQQIHDMRAHGDDRFAATLVSGRTFVLCVHIQRIMNKVTAAHRAAQNPQHSAGSAHIVAPTLGT